jgi:hypothetical protein
VAQNVNSSARPPPLDDGDRQLTLRVLGFVLALSCFGWTSASHAQSNAPDLVRLNDGKMVRGLIVELSPNDYVIVQTATGELQRYSMDDVDYAGPAASAPPPRVKGTAAPGGGGAPAPETSEGSLRIRVTSDQPGLTLHRRTGGAYGRRYGQPGSHSFVIRAYGRLCTAPCEFSIDPGVYGFAIEDVRGRRANVGEHLFLNHDSELELRYSNRSAQRTVRWVLAALFMLSGSAMMIASPLVATCDEYDYWDECYSRPVHIPLISIGAALAGSGIITMIIAGNTRDRAKITVRPLGAGQPAP